MSTGQQCRASAGLIPVVGIGNIFEPVVFNHNVPAGKQKFRINFTVIGIIDDKLKGIFFNFAQGGGKEYFREIIA